MSAGGAELQICTLTADLQSICSKLIRRERVGWLRKQVLCQDALHLARCEAYHALATFTIVAHHDHSSVTTERAGS
jgi:hypothetical protein